MPEQEYLGYRGDPSAGFIDFAGLAAGLGETVEAALSVRRTEREAFEQIRRENEEKINEYELGQNQTMNTLVMDGVDNIRDLYYEWNKEASAGNMTQADFKNRMNNTQSYWKMLSSSAKTFDERSVKSLERQRINPKTGIPDGSGFEAFEFQKYAEIADLSNKKIYTNPTSGKIYLATMGENGEVLDQMDVRQMNNPGNIIDNRVNLGDIIEKGTKGWDDYTTWKDLGLGATSTITDIRNSPSFKAAKNALVKSVLSNDRSTASVLKDNSAENYSYYTNEAEYDAAVERAVEESVASGRPTTKAEQGKYLIRVEKDQTGTYQPVLTPEQYKAAEERVSTEIEIRSGMEEKGTTRRAPRVGAGGEEGGDVDPALYEKLYKAWTLPSNAPPGEKARASQESANILNTLSGGRYRFEWAPGGMKVSRGTPVYDKANEIYVYPVISSGLRSLDDLQSLFYGTGTGAKGITGTTPVFEQQKEEFRKKNPRSTKPKAY